MSEFVRRHNKAIVWTFRILVGAVFIVSGTTKMIDVWGFIYKIEQYLNVWSWPQPRSLVLVVAMGLSAVEFLTGWFLITGCYKRTCVWIMSLTMLGMLPLTFYIAVANPVSDCGCFGDFLLISHTATFIKNVVISAMLVYLLFHNRGVDGLFSAYSQWLVGFVALIYIIVIGLFGYNIQPLVDFRPYKEGTALLSDRNDEEEGEWRFIYEKDGESREFGEDELPDSTWTFVDRVEPERVNVAEERTLAVFDGDEDVTGEVIATDGIQVMVLIPEMKNLDASSTYLINDMNRYVMSLGGEMIAILGSDSRGVEFWRDFSMASYDIYTAEDTSLKELARGNVSVVYLKDGVIVWKRSLSSIDSDWFATADGNALDMLTYSGTFLFWLLTVLFLGAEAVIWGIDRSGRAVKLHFSRRNRKK